MAIAHQLEAIVRLANEAKGISKKGFYVNFDDEADVLYLNFEKPSKATDTKLDGDVLTRYSGTEVVGITIMHASEYIKSKRK